MFTTTLSAVLVLWATFRPNLTWETNYAEALKHVRSYDKPLFIIFDTSDSTSAEGVQSGVFMSDKVERALSDDFVRLFVDLDTETGRSLAADFAVSEYPRLVVIDRSGEWQVYRKSGAHTADDVETLLGRFRRTKMAFSGSVSSTPVLSTAPITTATNCKT
jgi:hypothetical protein